jgi:hypothetical protein
MEYRKRVVDEELEDKLGYRGAVLIQGPKWCGKTTTASVHAKSILRIDDLEPIEQYRDIVSINPSLLLQGDVPRLLDEWQLLPRLWDCVRREVDIRGVPGQFILTGSAVPPDRDRIHHSGTGRFAWLTMRPMSLYESGESSGDVSLRKLFADPEQIQGYRPTSIDEIARACCRGGWPAAVNIADHVDFHTAFDYVDAVVNSDLYRVVGKGLNPDRIRRLMRAFARNQGQQVSYSMLAADVAPNELDTVTARVVSEYFDAMRNIFLIEDMPAWSPNLRSKTAIRTADTRYFSDPSLACASLRIGPDALVGDLNLMGFIFETLVARDLRVYAQAIDGDVYHYRDKNGLECDAVISLHNGEYALVEVKLGGERLIEEGAKTLSKLARSIDTDRMGAPRFMAVVVGVGDYAYRRNDGVLVVPISTLKN